MYRHVTIATLIIMLLLAACVPVAAPTAPAEQNAPTVVPVGEPTSVAEEATEQPAEEAVAAATETVTTTDAASSNEPLLNWEGEIDGACHMLAIEPSGQATVAVCGDEPSATSTFGDDHVEWAAIQEHFGSINAETSAGTINFIGQGNAESEAWAEALATWARFTAMEINVGRAGASNRTTLAWQLTTEPEHSGLCSQLIVLAYGYAYANQIPCDGNGPATTVATGWLSDTELDTFQTWVNEGARVESETGYLDAQGSTPVTPEEVTNWANAVYTRLLQ